MKTVRTVEPWKVFVQREDDSSTEFYDQLARRLEEDEDVWVLWEPWDDYDNLRGRVRSGLLLRGMKTSSRVLKNELTAGGYLVFERIPFSSQIGESR